MNQLQLYRKGNPTIAIPIDESTVYLDELMGRNDVTCSFYSDQVLDIKVDDYILLNDAQYTINVPFQVTRGAELQYSITFEHTSYWLKDIAFRHLAAIEFSYFGTPRSFMQLIVDCMNVEDSGWQVGVCEEMDEINLDFFASGTGYSCKGALQLIAEQFSLEYWFSRDGKTINLTKEAGVDTNIDFQYGRSRGLYSVERGMIETPLFNRIYGFGSSNNLSQTYRSGIKRLAFSPGYVERPLAEGERRRETTVVFEDIFPQRTSTFTAVSSEGLTLTDSTIDFDLNGQRINGAEAKVVFKSGALSGKEFEISKYNHSTKEITIKPITDANDYTLPNRTFAVESGDKYTLIGIVQPTSYVEDAENKLKEAVEKSFKQVSRPPYKVEIDEKYMRDNGFKLRSGDRVRLIDTKLNIDDKIRITSVSFPLVNPNQCTVVVSDRITYTRQAEFVIEQNKVKEQVKVVDRTKAEANRLQAMRMRQLQELTFDPDGYFDVDKIKPLSIETMMLSVGAKSQNFYLNGVSFEANAGDNVNRFVASAGQLIHREIEISGLGYIWQIDSFEQVDLDPVKHYYLSAKCSASSLTGEWHLSETPIKVDSEVGYLHFNIGVLYAVYNDKRDTAFTYGMTYINGGNITTGKISAERIDVSDLFAQEITATNLIVTGNSKLGPFGVNASGISSGWPIGTAYSGSIFLSKERLSWHAVQNYPNPVPESASFEVGSAMSTAVVYINNSGSNSNRPKGLSIDMRNNNIALEIQSGKVIVEGNEGITVKQAISTPEGTRYLNFRKGIMTGVTTS